MGSCGSCIDGDQDGPVLWYQPGTARSLSWCNRQTGFGYRRTKSYRQIAIGEKVEMSSVNREGNLNGDLSGRIVTYDRASKTANYSTFSETPCFDVKEGEKLFAKAFFPAPLHRIPIGENNIVKSTKVKGRGATILTPVPQAVAIFMDIDGVSQNQEHYCKDSLTGREREIKGADKLLKKRKVVFNLPTSKPDPKTNGNNGSRTDVNGNNIKRELLKTAVKGSFYTFVLSEGQLPFCFLHLPLIGNLHDTNISTGYYGENLIRCFCDVIRTLSPGMHKIDIGVRLVFDHAEYNYMVLGVGTNALGKWRKNLSNSSLKEPYENPDLLVCSRSLAKGGFIINISAESNIDGILAALDRKPPKEVYDDTDIERIRKIARTVAAGKYCEIFHVSGLPDWVVLSSDKITKHFCDQGRQYSYTIVEYVALWLNEENDMRPDAIGTMIEGAMARGELSPGSYTYDWIWVPRVRNNHTVPVRSIGVKNIFINKKMKGRKFSVFSTKRKSISISQKFLTKPTTAWASSGSTTPITEDDEETQDK